MLKDPELKLWFAVFQVFKCRKSLVHCFSSALIPQEVSSGKKSHCLTETGLDPELSALNEASLAKEVNFTFLPPLVSRVIFWVGM